MVKLTGDEVTLLKVIIADFGKRMAEAYNDKPAVREFLKGTGFIVPDDQGMDDEIYETLVTLDWFRESPEKIDEVPSVLLYGILKVIESNIPEREEDADLPEFDAHYSLLVKGMDIIKMKSPEILN